MNFASGVTVRKNVRIPMRDGTLLGADLYLPEDASEPLPVVMEYIPYRKDEVPPGLRFYSYLPQNGYIVARVDIRGTGASEGVVTDEYVPIEQQDGYDAIEWLAEQSFCDGNVNMMGISYGGFTSLQVATHQPPHLRTIIPMYFTDDRYTDDCHYRGGHLRQYYDVSHYGNFMIAYNALPPYPEWSDDWAGVWERASGAERAVPSEVAREPDRRRLLAARLGGRDRRPHPVPGVHDRRLAGRVSESAAAPVREAVGARARCWSARGTTPSPTWRCPARGSTTCTRSCAGSTTGARAVIPGSWTSPRW